MPNMFETRMGQTFYQGTMPQIAKNLERIADQLEKSNEIHHATATPLSITQQHWNELKNKLENEAKLIDDKVAEETVRYVLELMKTIEKKEG